MTTKMADPEVDKAIIHIKNIIIPISENSIDETVHHLRTLRKFCASGKSAQNYVLQEGVLLKIKETIKSLLNKLGQNERLCILVGIQVLANSLVDNVENQRLVWNAFNDIFDKLLLSKHHKIQHCTTVIIYNILNNNRDILREFKEPLAPIIALAHSYETTEFSTYILELLISESDCVTNQYEQLDVEHRMTLLSIIENMRDDKKQIDRLNTLLLFFGKYFVSKCQTILNAATNDLQAKEAQEIAKILEVFNSLSSAHTDNLKHVQGADDLLIAGIGLLRTIHALSKEQGNQFSMLLKIADLEAKNKKIEDHPGFGFKAGLVRLIGNMCWRHKAHQDTARELGAIPLILDCCNIDARNPLIIQWAVLAMRNLCENNLANQQVVATVDQKGDVDRSRLADMGLLFNGPGS